MINNERDLQTAADAPELSLVVIPLLKGVVYQESDPTLWSHLLKLQPQVRDYVRVLDLDLALDEAEGYAFLRSREAESEENETPRQPRLMARRQLSFPVSLLLALLRKKLAEFDAGGGETRLILTQHEIVELLRVFLPSHTNDARLVDQIETYLNKTVEMGFLRKLKPPTGSSQPSPTFEVRRIIKAFVDAHWLADLENRLEEYRRYAESSSETRDDE